MVYIIKYRPFIESLDNAMELFNEGCILLLMSFLLIYSIQLDAATGSNMGFAMIGLILFNIIVNIILFLYFNGVLIYNNAIKPLT